MQAILKKYDILLVVDEVICGFGRTGKMFACETYGIKPDVLVVSKQISSSYMPLSAIIMNDNFYQPIADESDRIGSFGHGYTASGHPVATAVGLENLKIIQERDLVGNVARLEGKFLSHLKALADLSDPKVTIETGGLSPRATELANRLAKRIAQLDAETLEDLNERLKN